MQINFSKYQGTGNDFILIDNRKGDILLTNKQVAKFCNRRFGIGADGLMLVEMEPGYDFKMVYYNSDGNQSTMCGNGGRCITKFVHDIGVHLDKYTFLAVDGLHESWIDDKQTVYLKMKDVFDVEHHNGHDVLDTGSPHFVKHVQDLNNVNVAQEGKQIRHLEKYKKQGINVNFVEILSSDRIFVRTYERGVEDETYSCGTGVTAAAIVNAHNDNGFNHIDVQTIGGKLFVEFEKIDDEHFENIWLCGPAIKVFDGILNVGE